ncbi:MAG TPA: beta-ketoacyl-[acyl-carrier-protein] synthase family protein [Methylovirgula sp.]|jgi:nodulation protein E|nr:beta-ketoacyl-[acyl-carrier-protein] synthase family protein [Methylovirgula sp.]
MAAARRVVITGMGAVSAAGIGANTLWEAARDGRSCISEVTFPRPSRNRIKIAAQVRNFNAADYIEGPLLPFCDPVTSYLIVAADEAMAQAGISRDERQGPRVASIFGTGIGGMNSIEEGLYSVNMGQGRPDPFTVPRLIASACPSTISMRYGTTGPCFAIASACSSATQAIGVGFHMIRSGMIDRAIVGGTEDCVTIGAMLAWEGLRVLTPTLCRPFSKDRNGMTLGAGAGVFVLEAEEIATARGAKPIVELAGYGTSSDAKDPVRPDAVGAAASMRYTLEDAGVSPDEIDYVNAHGTGTTVNDSTESEALGMIFGKRLPQIPVSSSKPIHGHGLGAGGALELIVTIGAIRENIAPPTINFNVADEKCPVDCVPNEARPTPIRTAISNSFAFGGINACLLVRGVEAA